MFEVYFASVSPSSNTSSHQDFQNQMTTMLNDTFSKLSMLLVDSKSTDSKSDWPKFTRDTKKFCAWYLAIIAQMSSHPWQEFYDSVMSAVVKTTINIALNGKLYDKLLICLKGQVLQNMVSRKHIRANGLLLLNELVQTYKP